MKRLTTLALLAGMLSAPALHSEEPGSGSAAPLSFPQLNDAADSEPGDEPPAASLILHQGNQRRNHDTRAFHQ